MLSHPYCRGDVSISIAKLMKLYLILCNLFYIYICFNLLINYSINQSLVLFILINKHCPSFEARHIGDSGEI